MSEITRLINAAPAGDGRGATQLLPVVYDELRKVASAKKSRGVAAAVRLRLNRAGGSTLAEDLADSGGADGEAAGDLLSSSTGEEQPNQPSQST